PAVAREPQPRPQRHLARGERTDDRERLCPPLGQDRPERGLREYLVPAPVQPRQVSEIGQRTDHEAPDRVGPPPGSAEEQGFRDEPETRRDRRDEERGRREVAQILVSEAVSGTLQFG